MRIFSLARLKPCLQTYGKMLGTDLSVPNAMYRNFNVNAETHCMRLESAARIERVDKYRDSEGLIHQNYTI